MTHLLAIMALMSAWINEITPESSIIYCHSFSTPEYLLFVHILSLLHWLLQHCCEGDSADTALMNTWMGSYVYGIALSIADLVAAS